MSDLIELAATALLCAQCRLRARPEARDYLEAAALLAARRWSKDQHGAPRRLATEALDADAFIREHTSFGAEIGV